MLGEPNRSVTRPQHSKRLATSWEGEFRQAFSEGRFIRAAEIFASSEGVSNQPELMLDVAQAQLAVDPVMALGLLAALEIPASKSREQVHRHALLAEAYGRTEDFDLADDHLEDAFKIATPLGDDDLIAYLGYRLVRRHLYEENPEKARAALDIARKGTSLKSRAFALFAETVVLTQEERFVEEAQRLIDYLDLVDPNAWPPPWPEYIAFRAYAAATLAYLAGLIYIPHALPYVERHLGGIPWYDDYTPNLYVTLRSMAWAVAQQGDYFRAFRYLKRASAAAPKGWEVYAACDRALLARCFGERGWSRVELDDAERLAAEVDWNASINDERNALLFLAELFAEIDPARSSMYLAQYRALGGPKMLTQRRAARHRAELKRIAGIVELALGNRSRGLTDLREARGIYDRLGFDFQFGECLAAEYRATGDRALLPLLDEKLRHYQQSWVAQELSQATVPKRLLSPMQQTVFEQLCQGKSTAQIATTLERSESTVNNHIKEIFKVFEVKSRAELLAKAAQQGLIGAP